ncbi:peptidylprolyl cis-trans isomerase lipoprotein, PpiC-type [Candidatus Magnetoovum chiemensis]|nr:peptidylprolyl cis-trans isomerase lipoprotein, PpiC-type [Candidatus Magnetoovum chiemensis]
MRKMQIKLIVAYVLFVVFVLSVTAWAEDVENKVLAEIDGKKITKQDFDNILQKINMLGTRGIDHEQKVGILNKLVNKEILYQEAVKSNLENNEDVKKIIEQAKQDIFVKYLIEKEIEGKAEVTDEEAKAYYDKDPVKFAPPAGADFNYMIMKIQDNDEKIDKEGALNLANEIKKDLDAGKKIEEMDEKVSKSKFSKSTAKFAHKVMQKGTGEKELEALVFSLKDGEVKVAELYNKIYVIKLNKIAQLPVPEYKDIEVKVKGMLKNEKRTKLFNDYIETVKKNHTVKVYEDNLK